MVAKNVVVAFDEEMLNKLENIIDMENAKKPKNEKLSIRVLPEEIALYEHYVNMTEYKNISDLIRKSVRAQIKKIVIPKSAIEQRFLGIWGIHRKIGKAIEGQINHIENEIEKIVEKIDVNNIDEEMLLDFIQKQQVSSVIAISLLRKKISEND